jgi:uncharacterized membrane protein YccC
MIYPGLRELIFSLKAFAAAMLSFWINCALDLSRPTWALFLVYVLMQPISGAVRSEAAARMLGSLAGAAIVMVLFALLANQPGALFLATGAAFLACFFLGLIDRMPSGHGMVIAGITIVVLGLPDTLHPLASFRDAVARIEEVLLAILCATLIDSVFFPHAAGVALNASVAQWLAAARQVMLRALRDPPLQGESHADLAKLAIDAAALDVLSVHVAYDSVPIRPAPRVVRLLHTRMLQLIRLIYSVQDWHAGLRQGGTQGASDTEPARRAFAAVADWVADMPAPSAARAGAARTAIDALRPAPDQAGDAIATLRGAMGELLRDLMTACEDCVALQRAVTVNATLPPSLRHAARAGVLSIPHGDPVRAALVVLPVALAFLLVFAYYTATGWAQGPEAAIMTILAGLYVGAVDEPGARLVRVFIVMLAAGALAIVYQFAVLPAVQDFPMLMLALGLFLIPAGAFIPITAGTAQMLCVLTTVLLGLQPEYSASFASVADTVLGALAGVGLTAIIARITLIPGSAWTTRHLLRGGWSDLAAIAAGRWRPAPAAYARRALDRYTSLAPYLDAPRGTPDLTTAALLGELRIGLNILHLREQMAAIPPAARPEIDAMLAAVAAHFDARRHGAAPVGEALRERGVAALAAATRAMPAQGAQTAWLMLAGVQRSLFGTTVWAGTQGAAHAG